MCMRVCVCVCCIPLEILREQRLGNNCLCSWALKWFDEEGN